MTSHNGNGFTQKEMLNLILEGPRSHWVSACHENDERPRALLALGAVPPFCFEPAILFQGKKY